MNKFVKAMLRKNKYVEMFAYVLQNNQIFNPSGAGEFGESAEEVFKHNANVARMYAARLDGDLRGATVLEVGTGITRATMLYMIREYGLKRAYCYDRFDCIGDVDEQIIKQYALEEYLDRLIYISGPNQVLSRTIENQEVDFVVSNAVLEHVDDLKLLLTVLEKALKCDGRMYHKVDLRCHNRFKRHGELYFHTFSDRLWRTMGGNIGQPNRMLLKDYLEMFEEMALSCEVIILEKFTAEDLAAARKYLNLDNVEMYEPSIVEFRIDKNCG